MSSSLGTPPDPRSHQPWIPLTPPPHLTCWVLHCHMIRSGRALGLYADEAYLLLLTVKTLRNSERDVKTNSALQLAGRWDRSELHETRLTRILPLNDLQTSLKHITGKTGHKYRHKVLHKSRIYHIASLFRQLLLNCTQKTTHIFSDAGYVRKLLSMQLSRNVRASYCLIYWGLSLPFVSIIL